MNISKSFNLPVTSKNICGLENYSLVNTSIDHTSGFADFALGGHLINYILKGAHLKERSLIKLFWPFPAYENWKEFANYNKIKKIKEQVTLIISSSTTVLEHLKMADETKKQQMRTKHNLAATLRYFKWSWHYF